MVDELNKTLEPKYGGMKFSLGLVAIAMMGFSTLAKTSLDRVTFTAVASNFYPSNYNLFSSFTSDPNMVTYPNEKGICVWNSWSF